MVISEDQQVAGPEALIFYGSDPLTIFRNMMDRRPDAFFINGILI